MTAAQIRAANRLLNELQVINENICSLLELGSEGCVFEIQPDVALTTTMSLVELHKHSTRFIIARNGQVEKWNH